MSTDIPTIDPEFDPELDLVLERVVDVPPEGAGTRYVARAIHGTPADRKKHEEMGFHEGWGKALDQLVEVAAELQSI